MTQRVEEPELLDDVSKAKDFHGRKFKFLTGNFYVMRAALRFFAVKQGMSLTASRVADNFPVSVTVAGSCLSLLDELDVVEKRTESSSPDRYMPQDVDMERMARIQEVLLDSYEIKEFRS